MRISKKQLRQIIKEELLLERGFFGKMLGSKNKIYDQTLKEFEAGIDKAKEIANKGNYLDAAKMLNKAWKNFEEVSEPEGGINKEQAQMTKNLLDELNGFEKRLISRMEEKEQDAAMEWRKKRQAIQDKRKSEKAAKDNAERSDDGVGGRKKKRYGGGLDPGDRDEHHGLKGNVANINRLEEKITKKQLRRIIKEELSTTTSFDDRKKEIVKIHDGFVDFLEAEGKFPMGEIPKSVMDAILKAAMVSVDAMETVDKN